MKKLSIHTLTHVPFEGLGCIGQWINKNNHSLTYTHFYENYRLPNLTEIDWLIVMGGPMGVYDEAEHPWLIEEKTFIRQAINNGKTVMGICLGSQLIAEVLGARVYPNQKKEIGWFDVRLTEAAKGLPLFNQFEERFPVFHWHGDTYDLPAGSIRLMSSDNCLNQAFLYRGKVLGLQFHVEVTGQSIKDMVNHGKEELIESPTIQLADQILTETAYLEENNHKMFRILDYLAGIV
ncbi:MAG: type 1 glutamine amidotransferase [Bacteroidota bacterium]|nr:type 1 glutamine amidotransferase [Bacteroidota bacterium]